MNSDHVFHIGDKVVYPNHGVGIIEQISSRTIGSTVERFYLLKIAASSLKVMIPFHNVGSVGVRPVVRNGEIQKIVDYLSSGACINAADWKDRFKENSERMRTGSLTDVAMVLKSLLILGQEKSLSFREKKMLERARYLLVSEIAISRNCDERLIEEALTKALTKCNLRFPEISELASYCIAPRLILVSPRICSPSCVRLLRPQPGLQDQHRGHAVDRLAALFD